MYHNVKVLCEKKYGQVRIAAVPPEEFLISRRATDLESAHLFVIESKKLSQT